MARDKGILGLSANFEPQVAAPLDARDKVPTKADLVLPATWTALDGGIYVFKGIDTNVTDDATSTNNGKYLLNADDYTDINNWEKIGSGSGTGDVTSVANITDNTIVRGDGGAKGVQSSNVTIDDTDIVGNVQAVDLDLAPASSPATEGRIQYNPDDETFDFGLPNGVVGQAFEEAFILGQNDTGSQLDNGTVGTYAGSIGASGHIRVAHTVAAAGEVPILTIGIFTQDIADGARGKLTTRGKVRGIQTDGANYSETWSAGEVVYKSSTVAGGLTNVAPDAPVPAIPLAVVIAPHATNGTLLVRPTFPQALTDLVDVNGTPLTTDGQILVWDQANQYSDFSKNINDYTTLAAFDAHLGTTTTPHTVDNYTHEAIEQLLAAFNGTFVETFTAYARSDGSIVTVYLEQAGGGDLTAVFSDGFTTIGCTPICTLDSDTGTIVVGTDSVPVMNYVYILQSDKILTSNTTGFPTDVEHIKIGWFYLPSAAYIQTDGPYISQDVNDHKTSTYGQGHISMMAERERRNGARWFSGLEPTGSDQDSNTSYFNYVGTSEAYFKASAGIIYQMHRHSLSAIDTSARYIHIINDSTAGFKPIHNLADITLDSTGASLSNKYFNIFIFAVGNKTGEYGPLMCKLPSGSYVSQVSAENDVDKHDDLTMPREFNIEASVGVPICRMTLKWSGGLSTLSHVSTLNLRTGVTQGGGASAGSAHTFADNQFRIFDETTLNELAFELSGLTANRTITPPDRDVIMGDHADNDNLDYDNSGHTGFMPTVNVKTDFGAKGDGDIDVDIPDTYTGTDDSVAIQNAIDYLASVGGGTLHFPPGIYLISQTIRVRYPRITISGGNHAVNFNTSIVGHRADSYFGPVTWVWIGLDSVVNATTREADLESVMLEVSPDYDTGTWSSYDEQFEGSQRVIQNHNKQEWNNTNSSLEADYGIIDDVTDLLHHGNIYQPIITISRADNTTYYPPWDHPEAWTDITATSGKSEVYWPPLVTGFKLQSITLLAGTAPTGAWLNRLSTKNAARCLDIQCCGHYDLENVYLGYATDTALQIGGLRKTRYRGWTTRFCKHTGVFVNQIDSVGMGIRIGEFLSTAEMDVGKVSDGHWKCEWQDLEVWWSFSEAEYMEEFQQAGTDAFIAMLEAENTAGRILTDNDPLCGMQICHADHVEWRNVNISPVFFSPRESLWVTGYWDSNQDRQGPSAKLEALTFNKLSSSVLMNGTGDTYPTRDITESGTFIDSSDISRLNALTLTDFNVGNGGGAGPNMHDGSFNVKYDTGIFPTRTGEKRADSLDMLNSSIYGQEQLVGNQWTGTAEGLFLYRHNRDMFIFSEMPQILMTGAIGISFVVDDLTDGTLSGTYTTEDFSWHGHAGTITISEKLPGYTADLDGHRWYNRVAHDVTVTVQPKFNFNFWNHGVMELAPWMTTANPLKFVGDSALRNSWDKKDSYVATLVIKQNAAGDGIWPGLDPATEAKIKWANSVPLPDDATQYLTSNSAILLTIRRSFVGDYYYCSWEYVGDIISTATATAGGLPSNNFNTKFDQTTDTSNFYYGAQFAPSKIDNYDCSLLQAVAYLPSITTGGHGTGAFTVASFKGTICVPTVDNPDATVTNSITAQFKTPNVVSGNALSATALSIKQGVSSTTDTQVGLEISDFTSGLSSNYALKTHAGQVGFGDTVEIFGILTLTSGWELPGGFYYVDKNGDAILRHVTVDSIVKSDGTPILDRAVRTISASEVLTSADLKYLLIINAATVNLTFPVITADGQFLYVMIYYGGSTLTITPGGTDTIQQPNGVFSTTPITVTNGFTVIKFVSKGNSWVFESMGKHQIADHTDGFTRSSLVAGLATLMDETTSLEFRVAFDSTTINDTGITLDTVTNIGRVTLADIGRYEVSCSLGVLDKGAAQDQLNLRLKQNGTQIINMPGATNVSTYSQMSISNYQIDTTTTDEYIEIFLLRAAGLRLKIIAGTAFLNVRRVG